MSKSELDIQNSFNSLSFMAQALIPLIDNLMETDKPQHKLKFHINKMMEELEKLSIQKYKAFKYADKIEEAKSVAVNLHKAGSSEAEIMKYIANKYSRDIAMVMHKFLLQGMPYEKRPHSYEDIMVITEEAYSVITEMIHNRKANEIVSLVTVLKAFMNNPDRSLDNIITEYTPIKK